MDCGASSAVGMLKGGAGIRALRERACGGESHPLHRGEKIQRKNGHCVVFRRDEVRAEAVRCMSR